MKLDKLTQLEWGYAANYFCQRDKMYGSTELRVLEVVKLKIDDGAAAHAPTTFGERMECLDIVPGILQMPRVASQPGSSQMRLDSRKPH